MELSTLSLGPIGGGHLQVSVGHPVVHWLVELSSGWPKQLAFTGAGHVTGTGPGLLLHITRRQLLLILSAPGHSLLILACDQDTRVYCRVRAQCLASLAATLMAVQQPFPALRVAPNGTQHAHRPICHRFAWLRVPGWAAQASRSFICQLHASWGLQIACWLSLQQLPGRPKP